MRDVRSVEGRTWLFMYDWMGWRRYLKLLGKDRVRGELCSLGKEVLD